MRAGSGGEEARPPRRARGMDRSIPFLFSLCHKDSGTCLIERLTFLVYFFIFASRQNPGVT